MLSTDTRLRLCSRAAQSTDRSRCKTHRDSPMVNPSFSMRSNHCLAVFCTETFFISTIFHLQDGPQHRLGGRNQHETTRLPQKLDEVVALIRRKEMLGQSELVEGVQSTGFRYQCYRYVIEECPSQKFVILPSQQHSELGILP